MMISESSAFPSEIYAVIVQFIGENYPLYLLDFSLVSRPWLHICRPLFFCSLEVMEPDVDALISLLSSPISTILPHVQRLEISYDRTPPGELEEFTDAVCKVLQLVLHRELEFNEVPWGKLSLTSQNNLLCYSQLTAISLTFHNHPLSQGQFNRILASFPNLRTIRLNGLIHENEAAVNTGNSPGEVTLQHLESVTISSSGPSLVPLPLRNHEIRWFWLDFSS
jgi:hypothetical protein